MKSAYIKENHPSCRRMSTNNTLMSYWFRRISVRCMSHHLHSTLCKAMTKSQIMYFYKCITSNSFTVLILSLYDDHLWTNDLQLWKTDNTSQYQFRWSIKQLIYYFFLLMIWVLFEDIEQCITCNFSKTILFYSILFLLHERSVLYNNLTIHID